MRPVARVEADRWLRRGNVHRDLVDDNAFHGDLRVTIVLELDQELLRQGQPSRPGSLVQVGHYALERRRHAAERIHPVPGVAQVVADEHAILTMTIVSKLPPQEAHLDLRLPAQIQRQDDGTVGHLVGTLCIVKLKTVATRDGVTGSHLHPALIVGRHRPGLCQGPTLKPVMEGQADRAQQVAGGVLRHIRRPDCHLVLPRVERIAFQAEAYSIAPRHEPRLGIVPVAAGRHRGPGVAKVDGRTLDRLSGRPAHISRDGVAVRRPPVILVSLVSGNVGVPYADRVEGVACPLGNHCGRPAVRHLSSVEPSQVGHRIAGQAAHGHA